MEVPAAPEAAAAAPAVDALEAAARRLFRAWRGVAWRGEGPASSAGPPAGSRRLADASPGQRWPVVAVA